MTSVSVFIAMESRARVNPKNKCYHKTGIKKELSPSGTAKA